MFKRIAVWTLLVTVSAQAQMAHEVLLLVNKNSQDSLHVANTFVSYRQIPRSNIVYLDIPESAYEGSATVTPEEFTRLVWDPAMAAAEERDIDDHVRAWIYSVDFPIRVKTDSSDRRQMSVSGLTFLRNQIPDLKLVEEGTYLSRLFGGPNDRLEISLPSFSLGVMERGLGMDATVPPEAAYLQGGLRERMPLPSMMLGYTGENGSSVQAVLDCMKWGRISDYRGIHRGIHFVVSDDVRSTCREWQYYPVVNALQQRGVQATVTSNIPTSPNVLIGLMMGAEKVDIKGNFSFVPGAMAEHLTSWGAEFQKPQTKVSEWIDEGATATAGTVVEPYSNPNKFPSARFFMHYTSGCSMLESFYQSIACPLQVLLLGEPLAKPYAVPLSINILGMDRIERNFTYLAKAASNLQNAKILYSFYLDGKDVRGLSEEPSIVVHPKRLSDGYHELRAVARIKHAVEYSVSTTRGFHVDYVGRSISILPDIRKTDTYRHAIGVEVEGEEMPKSVRLVSGLRVLDEKEYAEGVELELDEQVIGQGPNRIRVLAVYEDGMEVSSGPVEFEIKFNADS